jgi:hypothetical protein
VSGPHHVTDAVIADLRRVYADAGDEGLTMGQLIDRSPWVPETTLAAFAAMSRDGDLGGVIGSGEARRIRLTDRGRAGIDTDRARESAESEPETVHIGSIAFHAAGPMTWTIAPPEELQPRAEATEWTVETEGQRTTISKRGGDTSLGGTDDPVSYVLHTDQDRRGFNFGVSLPWLNGTADTFDRAVELAERMNADQAAISRLLDQLGEITSRTYEAVGEATEGKTT